MKYFHFPLLLFTTLVSAQEAHILFNRVNMGVYNPAFTGTQGSFLSVNSRFQWSGIKDAPKTNYLLYYLPKKKNVYLGFTAQSDQVFIENKTTFTVDYNYELKLSETQNIFLGLKGGGFYNNIDVTRLNRVTTLYNPALAPVESYFTPILGVGVQLQTPKYFLGIGIPSLFSTKRFVDNGSFVTKAQDEPFLYFSGGATFELNDSFLLKPVAIYRSIQDSPNLFTTTVAFEYQNQFTVGAGFSNNKNLAFFFSTKSIKAIELGYGYEIMNRGDQTAIQGGTHEFMLRFKFAEKEEEEESPRKDGYD
ncbi:PorP/SprF family type IX secretion system membrane protein [Flavobacteriaceae bacterium]|nr:PorP/SprF family type IX secretion system membrane protein [Flavobacteriaceae bacterium]